MKIVLSFVTVFFTQTLTQAQLIRFSSPEEPILERETVEALWSPLPPLFDATWKVELEIQDASDWILVERKTALTRSGDTDFYLPRAGTYRLRYVDRSFLGEFQSNLARSEELSVSDVIPIRSSIQNFPARKGPIIFIGDSLVEGVGADDKKSIPSQMTELLGRSVINTGVRGETTAEVLARLDEDALSLSPSIVLILAGWNDFRRGVSVDVTFHNLRDIVNRIHESGAVAVVVGLKKPILDNFEWRFREMTDDLSCGYVPNILSGIQDDSRFWNIRDLHPNDEGYRVMAERILPAVIKLTDASPLLVLDRNNRDRITLSWQSLWGEEYTVLRINELSASNDATIIDVLKGTGRVLSKDIPFIEKRSFFFLRQN